MRSREFPESEKILLISGRSSEESSSSVFVVKYDGNKGKFNLIGELKNFNGNKGIISVIEVTTDKLFKK